ncbi:cytosine DNA methyltransferase [South American cichlid iridovirus]|nr:cytosine DNA methyltransferase [South American cichlid iridovirus]
MRVLELFSGTGSVGAVARQRRWTVVSLDICGSPDIKQDILTWDYAAAYPPGYFDIVWASFPCETFSATRRSNIGRPSARHGGAIWTRELMQQDMLQIGVPLLRRAEEIIDYFKPTAYFMENPATGRAKDYVSPDRPMYIFDYCQYAPEWGYRKRTAVWTNAAVHTPLLCSGPGKCGAMKFFDDTKRWGHVMTTDGGRAGRMGTTRSQRYRVPPALISYLFDCVQKAC